MAEVTPESQLRVHIVCYEEIEAWILGKISTRLRENLERLGVDATISKVPDAAADINHHIIYYDYDGAKTTTETVMVTHIDQPFKLERVKMQLVNAEMGVCMSRHAVDSLTVQGVPRERLCFINPAHDGIVVPRRLVIGITTKIQPTGCKREWMVAELARRLRPEDFEWIIMGSGWEAIVEEMRGAGFQVSYTDHFDRELYRQIVPRFDYFLYAGMDEGSMAFIDALAAGVQIVTTPQGYHLDVPGGVTHPFVGMEELADVFHGIAETRNARVRLVENWTWREYARRHVALWRFILSRRKGLPVPSDLEPDLRAMAVVL